MFLVALKLGLTSFGGPVAHIGYFREEYVNRRKWFDEHTYADVVGFCQVLPGPSSSQVGISLGIMRAGFAGGVASWLGFTLPSAALLIAFAYGVTSFDVAGSGWVHGLKVAAVAIVAQAVWGMARVLTPDKQRVVIAIAAAIAVLAVQTAWAQIAVIAVAGVLGWRVLKSAPPTPAIEVRVPISKVLGIAALVTLTVLLAVLPFLARIAESRQLEVVDSFFRVGSMVFGGGHVVLPLLQHEVVPPGWVTDGEFLAGYGAAQAVPGPLFTFSAYLGAVMETGAWRWTTGVLALAAIFLPSFLFVTGGLPLWNAVRGRPNVQAALRGVNAAVVGLLIAALYQPLWTSAIQTKSDFSLGLALFGLLVFLRVPAWGVVACAAAGGAIIAAV